MNVLAVVAHPDDEVLGCGGTLAKHAEQGDHVSLVVYVGRGLDDNVTAAAEVLGLREWYTHPLPDQALDVMLFTRLLPDPDSWPDIDLVYTHNPDDLNLDHQLVARAVLTAFRPTVFHGTILAFETISSTEFGVPFQPDWYEVLSADHVEKKVSALQCYPSELREPPHPRNADGVRNRAMLRGDEVCADYAEAFRLLRRINARSSTDGRGRPGAVLAGKGCAEDGLLVEEGVVDCGASRD